MFGVVPRVLWNRSVEADDQNRIALNHNCLLLEATDDDGTARRVVIETGTGNKLDPKMRKIFALEDRFIGDAMREAGCRCEDVDAVIVSHLHFDHAGGLTRRCEPGETPDWSASAEHPASGDCPDVKLTFSNAELIVQEREWLDANENKSVMTRTYYRDHLEPLADRVRLVDSPRPFPLGYVPGRDELPQQPVERRMTEVLPGIFVFLVPGHTWGQQAILFTDEAGRMVVFTPDIMPTTAHAGSAYSLAYDVEPYTTMLSKHWFLESAVEHDWVLFLDHEPGNPFQRVRRSERGWYELEAAEL